MLMLKMEYLIVHMVLDSAFELRAISNIR